MKLGRFVTFAVLAVAAITSGGLLAQAPQAVGTWAPLQDLQTPLSNGASVALSDGRTLIVGGMRADGTPSDTIAIYDAVNDSLTPAGVLVNPRFGHTATLLKDGRIVITGGVTEGGLISTDIEVFDPTTGTSVVVAQLAEPRRGHVAASLSDGTVLIAGGATIDDVVLQTAAMFNPETNIVSPLSTSLQVARVNASATTLLDGQVLIAGGSNGAANLASAEIYDRYSRSFAMAQTQMSIARQGHSAVLLPHNGGVLIVGGTSNAGTDLFLPAVFPDPYSYGEGAFIPTGAMAEPRAAAVAGPTSIEGYAFAASVGAVDGEVYRFATIKTDKDDYPPGQRAIITGSGWQPGEDVTLLFQEDPAVHDDYQLTVKADAQGNIYYDQWAPEEHDLNVRFYLTARGSRSRAQMTFTDSRNLNLTFVSNGTGAGSVTITPSTGFVNAPVSCGGTGSNAASQTVTKTCSPNISISDNNATVTFSAVPSSGSAFAGWSGQSNLNASTCNGSTATCSAVLGGNPGLTATFNANGNQTIAVTTAAPASAAYGSSFDVAATASSFLPVTISTSGSCVGGDTDGGATITMTSGIGTCTVNYTQAGNASYNAAPQETSGTTADKAPSTTVVTIVGGPFPYTGAAQTPATVAVTGVGGLNLTPSATYANNINAGTATASYSYAGDDNHTGSGDSKTFTIDKAPSTTEVTIVGGPFPYTGAAQTPATVAVTGVGGLNLTPSATYANNINAGTATASYSYAGDDNHTGSGDSKTFTIDKAPSTTVVTIVGGPFPYTGAAQTPATVTVTGPGGLDLTPSATYANNINAGTATASYSYAGDDNHTGSGDSKTFTIDKAPSTTVVTIVGGPFPYTGAAQTPATVAVTGVGGLDLTPSATYANNINAGTATASYSYAGDDNHTGSGDSKTFTIDKAPSTTVVTIVGGPFPYTGAAQTPATVTVTGPGGLSLTPSASYANNINAGTATASYSYAGDDNHTESSDSEAFAIDKAPSTTVVTIVGGPFTYSGAAHTPATVTVTGPGGLSLTPSASYANNINAGTATASYSYAGDDNHTESSDSETFAIDKAPSTTVVTIVGGPFTYSGAAHTPATVTVTGPGGLSLTPSASYANNINAGTATASYSYAGDDNHTESSDSETFAIDKAPSTTVVTIVGGPFTYSGAAHTPATVTVTGPGGLSLTPSASYANNINAGTATASYSYAGDDNHTESSDSETFAIDKAPSTTVVTIVGGPFTYSGAAHTPATVTVTGPGGLSLTPSASYANNINAGTATASYSYAGDDNHTESSDSETFAIDKAPSTTVVTIVGGPFPYTGAAQTPATVTVTGPGGLSLTPSASYANNINAGTATASYSYAGDDNHTESSDSETFAIDKAPSTTVVTIVGGPFTYSGAAHTPATVTVTGAGSLSLTPTPTYANNVNAGTATASYSYAGDDNHTGSSDSKTFSIDKAASTVEVICTGAPFTYTGSAQTPCSAKANGAGALDQVLTVSYINNTNAGVATASASFAGDSNHTGNTGSANFTIGKASLTVKANDASRPFGVANPTFSGSYSGQKNGETFTMSFSTTATISSAVGTYPITPATSGATISNYSVNPTPGTLTVGAWSPKGFYQPVGETNSIVSAPGVQPAVSAATVWNTIKGGQTVPLKFNLYREVGGAQVTTVADAFSGAGFGAYQLPNCSGGYTEDEIALTDVSTGGTELRWDGTQFIQNWKTPKVTGADLCYRAVVTTKDGSTITAFFKVKK